jgi:hypothetical protein
MTNTNLNDWHDTVAQIRIGLPSAELDIVGDDQRVVVDVGDNLACIFFEHGGEMFYEVESLTTGDIILGGKFNSAEHAVTMIKNDFADEQTK